MANFSPFSNSHTMTTLKIITYFNIAGVNKQI